MKAYVYFAIACGAATACAYGGPPGHSFQHDDAGSVLHADAGAAKDASKPKPDAQVVEDASVDPPDVEQTTCSSLPLGTGMPQCDTCLGASCCAEDQACGNDQDCIGFIDCVNPCFLSDGGIDDTCEQTCESQYPNGVNELANLDSCMQSSCASPCGI